MGHFGRNVNCLTTYCSWAAQPAAAAQQNPGTTHGRLWKDAEVMPPTETRYIDVATGADGAISPKLMMDQVGPDTPALGSR